MKIDKYLIVFAADNNALEVRSLQRSGEISIPEVKAARDAFFIRRHLSIGESGIATCSMAT